MRLSIRRKVAAASAGFALLAIAPPARAQLQLDTDPPKPNVLILLDTSGSMERMIDSNTPEVDGNSCNYDLTGNAIASAAAPQPNRWGSVLQALTGTFENNVYNCIDMPRTSGGAFTKEYQIGGVKPYDADYYLDYHRPVFLDSSTTPPTACVVAPGALPGALPGAGVGAAGTGSGNRGPGAGQAATDFPSDGIVLRPFATPSVVTNAASGLCSQFPSKQYSSYQYQDGAIPSSTAFMRFGLMTFDQDPSPSIGVTSGATPTVTGSGFIDPQSMSSGAFAGMWSYFPGWSAGAACTYLGDPVNCAVPQMLAVGARNPAAPPWEGRMMTFPATNDLATQETNNQNIASVILASRPYGATPLAGMLQGAEYYFWQDPNGPQKQDPLVFCGNRPQYIIVLTDGAPNQDLRPDCSNPTPMGGTPGACPFKLPEDIVAEMNAGGGGLSPITTYVIGFAVSSATIQSTLYHCADLAQNGQLASVCNPGPADPKLSDQASACCELQKIALKGSQNIVTNNVVTPNPSPTPAFFADTPGALQKALSDILANIAKNATTRTVPAYAASTQSVYADPNSPTTVGSQYLASFNPSPGKPMTGDLVRSRDVCQQSMGTFGVTPQAPDPNAGDDFGANLNSSGSVRTFIAFQPDTMSNGKVDATATIRPYVSTTVGDGLGQYRAKTYVGAATSVIPNITPAALQLPTNCLYNSSSTNVPVTPGLTATQCATMTLDYEFGQQNFAGGPGNFPFVSRYGQALGGIYHAAPAIVGPPSTLLQDPGYSGFQGTWQGRKSVAYVATTDGLLHAFWSDETKLENNELWAMLPPAVMPNLYPSYPSSPALLLDGSPIVKDVAWDRNVTNAVDPTVWHTMLVAGFGPNNRGYYAVDVTNPDASMLTSGSYPPDSPAGGPHLRWQLTTMPATNFSVFAAHSATPAITTLFMDPDGSGAREIAVAILPGGADGAPTTSATSGAPCARAAKTAAQISQPPSGYDFRPSVRCWGNSSPPAATDPVNGRAVAIVRVDTGEIVRVFERKADAMAATSDTLLNGTPSRVIDTPLDSPMTGTPLVFPGDVATNATKAFVSDADGTIWRFDLSSSDPSKWVGSLFLDLYNKGVTNAATAWSDGQPLTVTPTLSTDTSGNVVIDAATGVTDTFDSNGIEFVYSITEMAQGTTTQSLLASVNWYMATPRTAASTTSFTPPATPEDNASTPAFLPGERVSGPMVVFDGKLYFSTYIVPPPSTVTCVSNIARVWGVDYVKPADTSCNAPATAGSCNRAAGGVPSFLYNGKMETDVSPLVTATDARIRTAVIPGLTINSTPACAGAGTPAVDQYVGGGAMHSAAQGFTPGSFSLSSQVGAPGANGVGAATVNLSVPTPLSPTVIDSWASVLE
jgi:type IV pilus assembly protein PilY1